MVGYGDGGDVSDPHAALHVLDQARQDSRQVPEGEVRHHLQERKGEKDKYLKHYFELFREFGLLGILGIRPVRDCRCSRLAAVAA